MPKPKKTPKKSVKKATGKKEVAKKVVGQTLDVGFEIGVQKTLAIAPTHVWAFLLSAKGLQIWLGAITKLPTKPDEAYATTDGTMGEIRSIEPGKKLRLTWKPADVKDISTLQITVIRSGKKTLLRFHHEKKGNFFSAFVFRGLARTFLASPM